MSAAATWTVSPGPVSIAAYRIFAAATGRDWSPPYPEWAGTEPATAVSWEDAQAYCAWLSETTGRVHRIPASRDLDAQWGSETIGQAMERGERPVWEWTSDPAAPDDEWARVVRGGSWVSPQADARCAFRYWVAPRGRGPILGFRVVVAADGPL